MTSSSTVNKIIDTLSKTGGSPTSKNSAQCYVAAPMGGEFEGKWIHVYVYVYVYVYVSLSPFTIFLKLSQYFYLVMLLLSHFSRVQLCATP